MVLVRLLDDVALHLHVLHDEVSTIERVGHDATHEGSGEHHCIGLFLIEELLHRILVGEVEFLVAAAHEIIVATALEVIPDCGTYQAIVTCYINLTFLT